MVCAKRLLESFAYSGYFLCLLIGIILVVAYVAWKLIFGKVDENCWFCNSDNLIPYKLRNRWTCTYCGQYNGFDKTGDYNKDLPEMYDPSYNIRQIAVRPVGDTKAPLRQQNKLCEKCSCNQLLMYKQLAQFRPIQENNFEFEVDEYKKKLEKLYVLCSMCQDSSQRYIKLQDTIIRGSMLQHRLNHAKRDEQNVNVNQNKIIQPRKCTAILFQLLMLALVLTYSLVSFCHFAHDVCVANFFKFEKTFLSTVSGYIVTASLALSITMLCFKDVPHRRTGFIYVVLWLACAPNLLAPRKNEFKRDHVYKLINLYSNNLLEIQAYNENQLRDLIFSATTLNFMSCFVLHLLCLTNLMLLATMINTEFSEQMTDNRHTAATTEPSVAIKAPELFSDEDSEESMDVKDEASGKQAREIELNGSLNALKLQDGESFNALFNSLNNSNSALPSALHTPPPSRSSSLLSLASHQSISSSNHLTDKKLSSINFARPSTELPFRKYNSLSTVHCWSNSPSLASGSVASFHQNSCRPRHTISLPGGKFHKPLISPAKLQWLASKSRPSSIRSMKNVKPHSDAEISFYDSVSQAGDLAYPEMSDDDDITGTTLKRRRTINSNTSSPKSTISNITSVTMQSVAEVENSRCCRWILAVCLLANLVLVVLLVMEVKEMRAMEKWKSHTSL